MDKNVSPVVVRRMPRYYRHLCELHDKNIDRISSSALAERMSLTASQVRQDFNCFGGFGQQGYGYNVTDLKAAIAEILCITGERKAILCGAGNLARALMSNFNFTKCGVSLVAAFDSNPSLFDVEMFGVPVHSISTVEQYVSAHSPDIAILTLPKSDAHKVANILVKCGVKGIWNFTGTDLELDDPGIPIENVHFSESLMVLSYQIDR